MGLKWIFLLICQDILCQQYVVFIYDTVHTLKIHSCCIVKYVVHIEIPQSRELIIMIIAFFELFRIAFRRGGGVVIVGTKAQEERILHHIMAKLPKVSG